MERDVDCCIEPDESPPLPHAQFDGGATAAALSCSLTLDRIGEVLLFLNSDGLSWKSLEPLENDDSTCLGITFTSKVATEIKFSDVYSVELISHGLIHVPKVSNARRCLSGHHESEVQVYRFTVHGFQQSKTLPSLRVLAAYTFGHNDLQTCQMWVDQINASLALEQGRPKNLLVFVHPKSGKGNGCKIWDSVAPIFSHAKVKTKVIVTQRSGHAYDMMASIGNKELASYDGVIAIGGDGFFNEILNGFLSSRHKAPYPPTPSGFLPSDTCHDSFCVHDPNETVIGTSSQNIEQSPLLPSPIHDGSGAPVINEDPEFPFPNEHFRFGIIPAGSTDAIVMWYGFYGDVITESEKYSWMGPKRYDYAGTRVFLKHWSYEAEVAYIEVKPEGKSIPERGSLSDHKQPFWSPNKSDQAICRVNCKVCSSTTPCSYPGETKWSISKGKFLSIGAAVISNRNERAPDGLVADAHLSDGFMHLILIKDCSHALYLWHLTQLAKKGGNPFDFKFVEHHKTTAFTFTSSGNESVWNLDGELFQAHQLSAQVFRGLVSLFASGPEI
ncbi:ceramide kinase isoform X29 [Malus sylvestris]|uniref:ceramide kinase isoform X28 n=1 Tax=Malus sylvestris TaxID=3752 RepID=UPI0021AD07FF|nr:ceramide kinase isoform X28 [Malus sylvestris]XP_050156505.1 ceramide kinase isoform X29 [Malus sylvestris]